MPVALERLVPRHGRQHRVGDRVTPEVQAPAVRERSVVPGGPVVVDDRGRDRRLHDGHRARVARHRPPRGVASAPRGRSTRRPVRQARRVVEDRVDGRRVCRVPIAVNGPPLTERWNVTDVVGVVGRRDRADLDGPAHAAVLRRRLEHDRRRRDPCCCGRRSSACGARCRARRRGTGRSSPARCRTTSWKTRYGALSSVPMSRHGPCRPWPGTSPRRTRRVPRFARTSRRSRPSAGTVSETDGAALLRGMCSFAR